MTPVPAGLPLALTEHGERLLALEQPRAPQRVYAVDIAAELPDAARFPDCICLLRGIPTLALSVAGVWVRQDNGLPA